MRKTIYICSCCGLVTSSVTPIIGFTLCTGCGLKLANEKKFEMPNNKIIVTKPRSNEPNSTNYVYLIDKPLDWFEREEQAIESLMMSGFERPTF